MKQILWAIALAVVLVAGPTRPAVAAGGGGGFHGGTRVVIGGGFGWWGWPVILILSTGPTVML